MKKLKEEYNKVDISFGTAPDGPDNAKITAMQYRRGGVCGEGYWYCEGKANGHDIRIIYFPNIEGEILTAVIDVKRPHVQWRPEPFYDALQKYLIS